jgi:hypothetical protein
MFCPRRCASLPDRQVHTTIAAAGSSAAASPVAILARPPLELLVHGTQYF